MKIIIFILTALFIAQTCFADKISSPPPFPKLNPSLEHYLYEIYMNFHVPAITTSAPNGSRQGIMGELVIYNNSGTFELHVNTDGSTTWQKIGP